MFKYRHSASESVFNKCHFFALIKDRPIHNCFATNDRFMLMKIHILVS